MAEPNPLRLKCKPCGLISTPPTNMFGYVCPNCGEADFETYRDSIVCDFCCMEGTPVACAYPARTFNVSLMPPGAAANSMGWWACCADCRSLIERGERPGLAERSADAYLTMHPDANVPRAFLVNSIRELHDQFWSNREGPPIEEIPNDD